jgi:hypothetical protein
MGGGSPSPAPAGPTQSNVVNTNIPDYAQPYVMNMLNATQSQIFKPDMSGFNAYTPYSNNPQDYVAGFSPLQQQAQSSAANLQTPGSYGAAQRITGYGIGNALQMGANATPQDFQNQVGGYMNPYIQNALQPQLNEIQRQYDITGTQEQSGATRAGAFGGSREALMAAENERNKNIAMNQAIGTGYNNAFNAAQNQYNQSGGFALQANQAAMQNAGQLAGIGGQELSAQQGIIGTQAQQGALEQQNQQNVINQAVQNYATAQQYPFMQLGVMNAMLRGLPLQQSTTSMYQAQPSTAQSAIGLLGAGTALASAAKRKGGSIKEKKMAKGGVADVPGYKYGTLINDEQLQSAAQGLNQTQMQGRIQDPQVNPNERQIFQGIQADQNRLRQIPGAGQAIAQAGMPPPPPQMPQQPVPMDARLSGIAQGGGPAFAAMNSPTRMAAGGITHFVNEGEVKDPESRPLTKEGVQSMLSGRGMPVSPERQAQLAEQNKAFFLSPRTRAAMAAPAQPYVAPTEFPHSDMPQVAPKPAVPTLTTQQDAAKQQAAVAAKAAQTQQAQAQQPKVQGQEPSSPQQALEQRQEMLRAQGIEPGVGAKSKEAMALLAKQQAGLSDDTNFNKKLAIAQGFLDFAQRPALGRGLAGMLAPAAHAVGVGATGYAAAKQEGKAAELANANAQANLEASDRKFAAGDIDGAIKSYEDYKRNQTELQVANINAQSRMATAGATQRYDEQKIARVMQDNPGMTYTEALQKVAGAGNAAILDITRRKDADAALAKNTQYLKYANSKKPEDQQKAEQIKNNTYKGYGVPIGEEKQYNLPQVHKTADGTSLYLHKDGLYYPNKES